MPAVKGMKPNSPDRGSTIARKKMKAGPNKGKTMLMRTYVGPDGKKHSAPAHERMGLKIGARVTREK